MYRVVNGYCMSESSTFVLISMMKVSGCCVSIDVLSMAAVSAWKITSCAL